MDPNEPIPASPMTVKAEAPHDISPNFNADDADVSFQSCDGTIFKIHSKNLDITCGGFPPSEFTHPDGDNVQLTEDAQTFEILFAFVYPRRQPQLLDVSFECLSKVAEASEKYEVFNGMNTCRTRMREKMKQHPLVVFLYGFEHGYSEITDECAPLLLKLSHEEVLKGLPDVLMLPWIQFRSAWKRKMIETFTEQPSTFGSNPISRSTGCSYCAQAVEATSSWGQPAAPSSDHYLTEAVLAQALRFFLKASPEGGSKMAVLAALEHALGPTPSNTTRSGKKAATKKTSLDSIYYKSIDAFEDILDKKLAELPAFKVYIAHLTKQ